MTANSNLEEKLPNNYLPPLKPPQKVTNGWMIPGYKGFEIPAYGCFVNCLLVVSGGLAIVMWLGISFPGNIYAVIPSAIMLIILSAQTSIRREILTGTLLEAGNIWLSDYPLRLGNTYQIRCRRELSFQLPTSALGKLTAQLVCAEVITYGVGTSSTTMRQILWQKTLHTQNVPVGTTDAIAAEFNCHIPANGVPSFEAEHNCIRWHLEVKVEFAKQNEEPSNDRVAEYVLWIEP